MSGESDRPHGPIPQLIDAAALLQADGGSGGAGCGAGSDASVIVVGMRKQLPRDIYEEVDLSAGSSLELPCRRVLPVVACQRPSRVAARLLGRVSGLSRHRANVYCVHRRLKEV